MEITGRLVADAQIITTPKQTQLVRFTVATNNRYKKQDGEVREDATFFNCSYWAGTRIAPYMLKGGIVELSGRVSAVAYTDNEGAARASLNFHTDRIKLYGGNRPASFDKSETHTEPMPIAEPEEGLIS